MLLPLPFTRCLEERSQALTLGPPSLPEAGPCVPRAACFPPCPLRAPLSLLACCLGKDSPFVFRLCDQVISSWDWHLFPSRGLVAFLKSQVVRSPPVCDIWSVDLPGWVVLLLSEFLRISFSFLTSSADLFDNVRKYHVLLVVYALFWFLFLIKCLFGRR